jgi:hypothetical protein|tara:strand:+ start:61 stop:393 length:333 start_codon:yes stop_codon:yes gene_type:complete
MSEYKWCHGPYCHTHRTQDRIRGSKGSKVLRTRKIKQWGTDSFYSYFCSQHCYNEFANKYAQQVIRIAPRNEPLETRIEDPVREKHTHNYSFGEHTYYTTTIKKIDTSME